MSLRMLGNPRCRHSPSRRLQTAGAPLRGRINKVLLYSKMPLCPETASKRTQAMRKLQRARPLRTCCGSDALPSPVASLANTTMLSDRHHTVLAELSASVDDCGASIPIEIDDICCPLKDRGASMEKNFTEQLDRFIGILRDACRDDKLSNAMRTKILEVIELRARGWKLAEAAGDIR
ncbi:hypothetical protein V5799_034080 [Amblyomma americanum]|uniref:MIF4G domain-containing protein n=1 Tax=Amblyomma americanum TaxID=6943 RepID=A0AAQ4DLH0_AMBAM